MTKVEWMSAEASLYYEGGKRVLRDGVPCRVAAWVGQRTGKSEIAKLVAEGVEIGDDNALDFAPRFRFVPAEREAPLHDGKPSARGQYGYRSRMKSRWWKPSGISAEPMYGQPMTDTSEELRLARKAWAGGDPSALREWLLETAEERRVLWAGIDASRAVAAFAAAVGAIPAKAPAPVVQPVVSAPVSALLAIDAARIVEQLARAFASVAPAVTDDNMSRQMSPEAFRALRERLGWTQKEMAAWGDVAERTIIRFEKGDQPVPKIWWLALQSLEQARNA